MEKVKIGDLKEMEDVADIALDRCRNRLIYLQNKVEKRKNMLEKVKDKLANIEEDTTNEECENIMRRLEIRNFDIGKQVSAFKTGSQNTRSCEQIGGTDIKNNLCG